MTTYPVISSDSEVQAFYERMRRDGQTHFFAEMAACRQAPGTKNTDRAFMHGRMNGQDIGALPEWTRKRLAFNYKKETGCELPQGAAYISQLASKPGDPRAVVGDLSDVARRCRETGKGCEELGIKAAEPTGEIDQTKKRLGGRLLKMRLAREMKKPENKGKDQRAIAEKIIDKHGYAAKG